MLPHAQRRCILATVASSRRRYYMDPSRRSHGRERSSSLRQSIADRQRSPPTCGKRWPKRRRRRRLPSDRLPTRPPAGGRPWRFADDLVPNVNWIDNATDRVLARFCTRRHTCPVFTLACRPTVPAAFIQRPPDRVVTAAAAAAMPSPGRGGRCTVVAGCVRRRSEVRDVTDDNGPPTRRPQRDTISP